MSPAKKVIEINGRQYNAATGNLLSDEAGAISMDPAQLVNDILALDNLPIGRPRPAEPKAKPIKVRVEVKTDEPETKKEHIHAEPHADIARKPEKSATLMRPAVKKPAQNNQAEKHIASAAQVKPVNKNRLWRAKHTPKSSKVKKFHPVHSAKQAGITPKLTKLEVKEQSAKIHRPKAVPPVNNWPVIDQFEKAMHEASSHLETFVEKTAKSKKSRKLAYSVACLSILLLASYGVYHFLPVAKVKMASNKAGFSADLPAYSPAGFGLADPIVADYGKVTLSYKSRTDDKGFELIQSPSGWNSQALVANFLDSLNKDYQTVEGAGHTIYTYNNADATWVDSGKWYKVEGNARLSDDQLVKLANSL